MKTPDRARDGRRAALHRSVRLKETIARNLRAIRIGRGITQLAFIEKCGLSQSSVSMFEHGHRTPSLEIIERLAAALEVPLVALFDERQAEASRHRRSAEGTREPGEIPVRKLIVEKIRTQRHERRLTQEEFAKELGVSRSYLSAIELGKRTFPIDTLERIAKALGVAPVELVRRR